MKNSNTNMLKSWKEFHEHSLHGYFLSIIVVLFYSGALFPQSIFAVVSCQANLSQQKNSLYFLQTSQTRILVKKKSNILLNANVILYNNIDGDGCLILSSKKNISVNANGNRINNVLIRGNTKIKLKGHLQIERSLRIIDKGEVTLGDFELILPPEILFDDALRNRLRSDKRGKVYSNDNSIHSLFIVVNVNLNQANLIFDEFPKSFLRDFFSSNINFQEKHFYKCYENIDPPPPKEI